MEVLLVLDPARDDRGRSDLDVVEVKLTPAERILADRVETLLVAARGAKLGVNVFTPDRRKPPTRRYRDNAGARVAFTVDLAAMVSHLVVPTAPRTLRGLPPDGYRVRSTANARGSLEPLRSYESEDDVFLLTLGSSGDDVFRLAGWAWGWDVIDHELLLEEVQPMSALPLLASLTARRSR
jgi:hypothetical protein